MITRVQDIADVFFPDLAFKINDFIENLKKEDQEKVVDIKFQSDTENGYYVLLVIAKK